MMEGFKDQGMRTNFSDRVTAGLAALLLIVIAVYREPLEIGNPREIMVIVFRFGLFVLLALALWAKISRFAAVFLVLAWVSALVPLKTKFSGEALVIVVFGIGWYALLMLLFKNYGNFINYALCVIAVLHSCVVINGGCLMPNPNEGSALFALCFSSFLLLGGFWQLLGIIPIAGLFMVKSFNGILSVVIVMLIYGVYKTPSFWYLYVCAFIGIIGIVWKYFDQPNIAIRLDWWSTALKLFFKANNWIHGCGLGNWKQLSGQMVRTGKITDGCYRLHNTWIQSLLEMGASFGVLVLTYAVYVIKRLKGVHIAHILGVVAFLIVSSTNSLFRMNIVNGMIAIALLVRLELEIRSQREPQG